ncbi:MAG: fructosamine kinase family protein [Pseudomonadota bacterium]
MKTFIKSNPQLPSDTLLKEAQGLEMLRQALSESQNPYLNIPIIHAVDIQELRLEHIENSSPTSEQIHRLGQGLAQLHKIRQDRYGLGEDNYIGLAPQANIWCEHWGEFFAEYRLAIQINRICDASVRQNFAKILTEQKSRLTGFLNTHCEHPSLLHGDLWSGNVMFDREKIWLIDPAVYYGDREADVAMTEMFGGFNSVFYQAYDAVLPRSSVYRQKQEIYNLYHYLNHYNLFGSGYLSHCEQGFEALQKL